MPPGKQIDPFLLNLLAPRLQVVLCFLWGDCQQIRPVDVWE
jgi:hypothetical protein